MSLMKTTSKSRLQVSPSQLFALLRKVKSHEELSLVEEHVLVLRLRHSRLMLNRLTLPLRIKTTRMESDLISRKIRSSWQQLRYKLKQIDLLISTQFL